VGLFDSYQLANAPQGSLIDRILAQLGSNNFTPQDARFQTGLASDQAQYGQPLPQPIMQPQNGQPSPLDTAQWPHGPVGAPSQANAGMEQYSALPVSARVPQQGVAQPQQELPPALGGGGYLDRVRGGGGLITSLFGESPQQQNLKAQYNALVPILGQQRATLAVLNPEMGKALLQQAVAGKQFQFTTAPDGTVIRTDAHAGTAQPVYQGGLKPQFGIIGEADGVKQYGWIDPSKRTTTPVAGIEPRSDTVTGPDGKPIAIPEGVDRKEFIKKVTDINAKAATGEKNEVQAKSEKFGNKMELAEKNIKDIEDEGTGFWNRVAEGSGYVPGSAPVGRFLQTEKYQKYRQARDNFITALLRDESGAAIGTDEFNRYEKELFPQPGDSKGVIDQKREARRIAIEGMKKAAGPGYKSPTFDNAEKADPLGIRR
jgi:hypothetical protein